MCVCVLFCGWKHVWIDINHWMIIILNQHNIGIGLKLWILFIRLFVTSKNAEQEENIDKKQKLFLSFSTKLIKWMIPISHRINFEMIISHFHRRRSNFFFNFTLFFFLFSLENPFIWSFYYYCWTHSLPRSQLLMPMLCLLHHPLRITVGV